MNKQNKLRDFYILWSTQSLSQLGSTITAFALTLWLYDTTGSSLSTAALRICTYTPYILMSIFAGAITDKIDKKKAMLFCDLMAALTTVAVFVLYKTDTLSIWHLYLINAFSGLMNTIQQPASEVAYTMVIPKEQYQKTSGLQSLSRSLITIGHPLIAPIVYGFGGLDAVIAIDLFTFAVAFIALFVFIKIPNVPDSSENEGSVLVLAREGLAYLKENPMILYVILFMAGVNFIASAFDAALPAHIIPNPRGGNFIYWCRNFLFGRCYDFRKPDRYDSSEAEKSREDHISVDAFFARDRKLHSCIFKTSCHMVYRTDTRMDICTGYGSKSKCYHAQFHTCQITGTCICLQKHPSVFHHSSRSGIRRFHGRSCMRTADEKCSSSDAVSIRKRQRFRCCTSAVYPGYSRNCDVSHIRT